MTTSDLLYRKQFPINKFLALSILFSRVRYWILNFFIVLTAVTPYAQTGNNDKDDWYPFEHPAIIKRRITAFTAPARTLNISAEFPGRVLSVHVNTGNTITGKMGDKSPVIVLDSRFATIARDRAKTDLEIAIQQSEQLKIDLSLAKRQLEFHRNEVERIESLAKSGKVRQSDLDETLFNADISALQVDRASMALALAETSVSKGRHNLADAEERLARHTIFAPSGWVVLERSVEPGAIVDPEQTLLRLADLEELAIESRLSEDEIAVLEKMSPILIQFQHHDYPSVAAKIHRIDVDHDPATNKRLVELRIPGESAPVKSGGLEVSLVLLLPDPGGLLQVPKDFLTLRFEQYFVTLKAGKQSTVTPIREQGANVLISRHDLPESAILTRPQKSSQ